MPQLVENYKSQSAEGISLAFLTVWFIGDLANFFGAVWAGLVPTVIALAIYFCFADAVLITQCLYYNYINAQKAARAQSIDANGTVQDDSSQPLLRRNSDNIGLPGSRRRSSVSQKRRDSSVRTILPTIPEGESASRMWAKNAISVILVCAVGTAGWAVAWKLGIWKPTSEEAKGPGEDGKIGAAILGYISAVCYLGARIPQIWKNYRERSCEGIIKSWDWMGIVLSSSANPARPVITLLHAVPTGQCHVWRRSTFSAKQLRDICMADRLYRSCSTR